MEIGMVCIMVSIHMFPVKQEFSFSQESLHDGDKTGDEIIYDTDQIFQNKITGEHKNMDESIHRFIGTAGVSMGKSATTKEIAGNVNHVAPGIREVTENVNLSPLYPMEFKNEISTVNQESNGNE